MKPVVAIKSGGKGLQTEELIRRYFNRAGFFVVRGIKLKVGSDELTDIDLWVYERSATLARRRTVIDMKDRRVPQAAERLFFIMGLAEAIGVEGAGLVTTDDRVVLRELARKHQVLLIDGGDLQRLKKSVGLAALDRISEEALMADVQKVDQQRQSKHLRDSFVDLKSLVADRFGVSCANLSVEKTRFYASEAIASHPDSLAARTLGRLTFFAAALACASYDFACADWALRPAPDRLRHLTDAIRYGDDQEGTVQKLKWAEMAVRDYLPNGNGAAQTINQRFNADLTKVPAEGLAEVLMNYTTTDGLFQVAKELETAAFTEALPTFDGLSADGKSVLGAQLDFVGISRASFAKSWKSSMLKFDEQQPLPLEQKSSL